MIQMIQITNAQGDSIPLTLMNPETSGFYVIRIDGLGPVKSTISTKDIRGRSGTIFGSARTGSRNIVFTLGLLSWPTIEASRLRTYTYFPVEGRIRIDVLTDVGNFYIYGYVESNEPTIFSKETGTVISVLCPDPFFRIADEEVFKTIVKSSDLFSFPFENDVGTRSLIFGELAFDLVDFQIEMLGPGVVPVGPTFFIRAAGGPVTNPKITFKNDLDVFEHLEFAFSVESGLPSLETGDILEIVCDEGRKSVRRLRVSDNTYHNYIGAVTLDSAWPMLRPGVNDFVYSAQAGGSNIKFSYTYTIKYSGV